MKHATRKSLYQPLFWEPFYGRAIRRCSQNRGNCLSRTFQTFGLVNAKSGANDQRKRELLELEMLNYSTLDLILLHLHSALVRHELYLTAPTRARKLISTHGFLTR